MSSYILLRSVLSFTEDVGTDPYQCGSVFDGQRIVTAHPHRDCVETAQIRSQIKCHAAKFGNLLEISRKCARCHQCWMPFP